MGIEKVTRIYSLVTVDLFDKNSQMNVFNADTFATPQRHTRKLERPHPAGTKKTKPKIKTIPLNLIIILMQESLMIYHLHETGRRQTTPVRCEML